MEQGRGRALIRHLTRPLPPDGGVAVGGVRLRWSVGTIAAALVLAAALGVALGFVLHHGRWSEAARPVAAPSLPLLHGIADWPAGRRAAPNLVLRDSQGAGVSPAAQRGRTVLIVFLDAGGGSGSVGEARALGATQALLDPVQRPAIDVVSLRPGLDSPGRVGSVARHWGLTVGEYHWLVGPRPALSRLSRMLGVDPRGRPRDLLVTRAIYLVDRRGWVRAGYLYPLPPTVLARDLRTLALG